MTSIFHWRIMHFHHIKIMMFQSLMRQCISYTEVVGNNEKYMGKLTVCYTSCTMCTVNRWRWWRHCQSQPPCSRSHCLCSGVSCISEPSPATGSQTVPMNARTTGLTHRVTKSLVVAKQNVQRSINHDTRSQRKGSKFKVNSDYVNSNEQWRYLQSVQLKWGCSHVKSSN